MSTLRLILGGGTSGKASEIDLHEHPRESWVRTHREGVASQSVVRFIGV